MWELEYKPSGSRPQIDTSHVEGLFAERFLELCQERFATLYKRVSERFWNNGIYGHAKCAYYMCRFEEGVAEYNVITTLDGENRLRHNHITVVVLSELDREKYLSAVCRVQTPSVKPVGYIDSETVFVVAPKTSKEHKRLLAGKPWKEKLKYFLPTIKYGSFMAYPIVASSPEVAFKKLMDCLVNFWKSRVKGFLDKLKIQPYQYDYKEENLLSNTYNSICKVLENYNRQIVHCLRSMVAHFVYFRDGLRDALRAIGGLNMLKNRAFSLQRRLNVALNVLEPKLVEQVVSKLEGILLLTCAASKSPP